MTDKENEEEYFLNLTKSFQLNQNSPGILLTLGEVLLKKGEYGRAENLANRSLEIIENMSKKDETKKEMRVLKSNLLILLGKIEHSKEEFNKAFKFYGEAVNTYNKNVVGLHYLGTMNLHLRNYQEAEKNFENVLKLTKVDKDKQSKDKPLNIETMKILAQTKARMFKREEAIKLLDLILENDRTDIESYLLAAYLTEQNNYLKALTYYRRAVMLLEEKFKEVSSEKEEKDLKEEDYVNPVYYNNIAVLYMKLEKIEEAHKVLLTARETLNSLRKLSPNSTRLKSISLILHFNEACQLETLGEVGQATNIYKYIIKEEPYYVDAYLRLAILAKQRGSIAKAVEYGEKAVTHQIDKKPVVPY